MIDAIPIVTAFDQKSICFSVDIFSEGKEVGKASVILGKIGKDEPKVRFYQAYDIYINMSNEIYSKATESCIYASKVIWG